MIRPWPTTRYGPMKKAIVAKRKILKGEVLSFSHLWFKRTAEEAKIRQMDILSLIGCKTNSL